jgi:hypothetical protein
MKASEFIFEQFTTIPFNQCPGCGGPVYHISESDKKRDACYHKVRSKYKVWPSAYASGALVQCRKKGAKNWGNKSESISAQIAVAINEISVNRNTALHKWQLRNDDTFAMMAQVPSVILKNAKVAIDDEAYYEDKKVFAFLQGERVSTVPQAVESFPIGFKRDEVHPFMNKKTGEPITNVDYVEFTDQGTVIGYTHLVAEGAVPDTSKVRNIQRLLSKPMLANDLRAQMDAYFAVPDPSMIKAFRQARAEGGDSTDLRPVFRGFINSGLHPAEKKKAGLKESLMEGGNVFAGRTAGIARENIESTMERYFSELKQVFPKKASIFNTNKFIPLGSVGKKPISGDIDLGVDAKDILDQQMSDKSIAAWGVDPAEVSKQQEKLAARARTATPEELRLKAFLQLLALKINSAAKNLYVDEKKITAGNIFGLFPQYDTQGNKLEMGVQIDWMIGNLEWLKFSYYSSAYPEGSNVKGLHRTQLMLSAFQVADLSFNHVKGVTDKNTGKVVATNPKQALSLLNKRLKVNLTPDIVENYYTLHDELKKSMTPADYDKMIDIYLKILDSTRADIPDNLQKEWIARQERLGLKGKFLPDTSALASRRVSESGVAGAARVPTRAAFNQFLKDYEQLISKFPGYQSMEPTGSYHSDPNKQDFGDIDLVIHIQSDDDKAKVKKDLVSFLQAQPETVVVPFSSVKHAGKRTYNAGELVSVRFHSDKVGDSAQIDNIIALSSAEAQYKKEFLNYAAPKQGLILGLVKVATLETDPAKLFKMLGIKVKNPKLGPDQEWEFNISPVELQLRRVQYEPGTFKQSAREVVWNSRDMDHLSKLLYQYDLNGSFEQILDKATQVIKNPRSGKRIAGTFKSMITVKSGEEGTPKAKQKIDATTKIEQAFQ